jgi:hypothetical protein
MKLCTGKSKTTTYNKSWNLDMDRDQVPRMIPTSSWNCPGNLIFFLHLGIDSNEDYLYN